MSMTKPAGACARFAAEALRGVCLVGGFLAAGAATAAAPVWIGGSGAWSDAANWRDGLKPAAGDTVYVSNAVADVAIDIDEPGVSIASIRFEGRGHVELVGEALTLTGGWSFKGHSSGGVNMKDYAASTFPWLAYGANVDCRVPLVFAPSGAYSGICTATNVMHFHKAVTIQGSGKTFYLHAGLQPTPDDIAAGVPNQSITASMYFHDVVTGPGSTIKPVQHPAGHAHFMKAVKVKSLNVSGWTSANYYLYSTENEFDDAEVDYGNIVVPMVQNAYPAGAVMRLAGTYTATHGMFNLGNFDTTIDRLDASATGIEKYANSSNGGRIVSASTADGSSAQRHPATLTMNATADGTTTFMVQDCVSLVWNPAADYTLTFTNRTSGTKGSIRVKRGKVRLTGNAAFPNVREVTVDAGAKFSIESSAAKPISASAYIHLGQGAKLCLAQGVSISAGLVCAGGTFVADGTYSGAGENAVDWIEGDGEIVVSGSGVCAWKSAADGTWSDSSKWVGGRVPDGTERAVYVCNDSADDFTVSIASALASFPTNFHIRNFGGGRAILSCAADVTSGCADVAVGEGGLVRVENGATFLHSTIEPAAFSALQYAIRAYSPGCVIDIAPGGRWLNAGGSTVFTNFYGTFTVRGSAAAPARFDMRGGEFLFCNLDSAWPINVCSNGIVDLRDGDFRLPHHGYNHDPDMMMRGGSLCLSNVAMSTVGDFPTPFGGSVTFGTGETVFDGTSTFELYKGNRMLRPNALGQTARLAMKGDATFSSALDYSAWMIGGRPGGKAVFDYEAGDSGYARVFFVGDLAGEAELNVKSGLLRVHNCGLSVAGNAAVNKTSETNVTGRVVVEDGAAMYVTGSMDDGWEADTKLRGTVVGAGAVPLSGHPLVGRMDVFGVVTNGYGSVAVGFGAGDGTYVQHGGASVLMQDAVWGFRAIAAVGMWGGIGRLIVSNGTFDVKGGTLFVGGCPADEVTVYANKAPHARVPWNPKNLPANNHDARGTVTVAGGAFSAAGNVLVGTDGAGAIEMAGKEGTFTAGGLVLSNATSSVVRFIAGADGFSPVNVTGALSVTDGATVEVDLSAYTGGASVFRLFNLGSFVGDIADVSLVVRDANGIFRKPCRLRKTAEAVDLAIISGTMVIVR